ncbi:MAG TPA: DUF2155 domain-containing protein [Brevundimonas sp.]|jgi:hypothetical protein|uniref:DUF2155 domain-containing protein n=1 Tax=Brevundimonas sp. TaxID=1871086 RepID=UPI002E0D44B2|nr:DUF2155 domain-containing protein [Brevundimonas sp.]
MTGRGRWLLGAALVALAASAAGLAQAVQDPTVPQTPPAEPQSAPADPVGAALQELTPPAVPAPAATPAPAVETAEVAPEGEDEDTETAAAAQPEEPETPQPRQRRPIVVVQALDKITAETMRFEVEVGGRPVRFNNALIVTARACEVSAADERDEDAVAYLEVSLQPRGAVQPQTRQLFRGWMFASTPGLSTIDHPVYDAWVVGCRA